MKNIHDFISVQSSTLRVIHESSFEDMLGICTKILQERITAQQHLFSENGTHAFWDNPSSWD